MIVPKPPSSSLKSQCFRFLVTRSEAESWGEGTSWDDGGSCGGCGGCGWTKGDAIAKGKFKGAKGKGKGPVSRLDLEFVELKKFYSQPKNKCQMVKRIPFFGETLLLGLRLTPSNADVHVFCLLFDGKNDPNEW